MPSPDTVSIHKKALQFTSFLFQLNSIVADNMENTTQTRLILSEMDFVRSEAIEWTEKHRLKFICNLRKYYHSKAGKDCPNVL